MGLFDNLFGKKEEANVETVSATKGVRFKEEMIKDLKEDHQKLFALYGSMIEDCKAEKFDSVLESLTEFSLELDMHIYIENTQLYTYIKNYFDSDESQKKFIDKVQHGMDGIAKAVEDFGEKWSDRGINNLNKDDFISELEGLGKTLTKRTSMEEARLYTLYQS